MLHARGLPQCGTKLALVSFWLGALWMIETPAVRRNPTIINLYDRPLYPRPSYSGRHLNPIEYPRPTLSYLVIAGALLYCAVYLASGLGERRLVAPEPTPPTLERADAVPILTAPEAPAPDMSSADVRFAAADANSSHVKPATTPEPAKIADNAPQKKRRVHIVAKPKEPEQDGLQAYAFSFAGPRTHDGGF